LDISKRYHFAHLRGRIDVLALTTPAEPLLPQQRLD
jgi:hypothetical protein